MHTGVENMKNIGIHIALLLWAAPLIASEPLPDGAVADAATTLVYRCDDDKKLTAVMDLSNPDLPVTRISVDGEADLQGIELHDVMSANGVKTSNGKLVWWTKGDEGFLAEEDPPAGSGDVIIGGCQEIAR